MSNKKQTAVEWIAEQIKDYDFSPASNTEDYVIVIPIWILNSKVQEAKAMEKEQIIDAFWNGDNSDCTSEQNSFEFAEQYYKETYEQ